MSAPAWIGSCSALAALLLTTVSASAQSSPPLEVRVVDPTGAPVAGADVRGSQRDGRLTATAATDAAGVARLALPCECLVLVDARGFAPFVAIVPARERAITAALSLGAFVEQVTVTASGHLQVPSETSKSVDVVDAREIEARGELTAADAVRTVPGVTVQQLGGPGAFTSIKLRGLREQDTAVLIDGVRFRDPASPQGDATAFVGELYLTNVERVEVLRGSGSSVHGSHAVAGAVNLITRAGGAGQSVSGGWEAGQLGFGRAVAHAGGSHGRLAYSIGAGRTRTLRGIDGNDPARNTSAQGRADIGVFSSGRATVRAYRSDSTAALNDTPSAIGPLPLHGTVRATPFATFIPAADDPDSTRHGRFTSMLATLEQRPSPRVGYSLAFHHLATARVFLDGPLGATPFEPPVEETIELRGGVSVFDARADIDWDGHQTTSARYEREREQYDSRVLPADRLIAWRADLTQASHSVSLQHQLRTAAWHLAAGVRAQAFALQRVSFQPAERVPFAEAPFEAPPAATTADVSVSRWFAASATKLQLHAGNAYRAPAMFERAGATFGSGGYTVYGDPTLGPERAVSFDVGLEQRLARGRVQVSGAWFQARLRRVIAFGALDREADPFGRSAGYRMADGRRARGVELGIRGDLAPRTGLKASYTFADADAPAGNLEGLPRAAAVPAHQLALLLTHEVQRLQLSLQLDASSRHYVALFDPVSFASRAYAFDGGLTADVAAAYTHPAGRTRLRVFLVVDNALNRERFVQGFRTPGRVVRGGVGVIL